LFVRLRATILYKLDHERSERDKQDDVNQPAFVQQKLSDQPDSDQNCAYDPEHFQVRLSASAISNGSNLSGLP
jgi:hypothetical protein